MNAIDLEVIYQSTQQIARELTVNMMRTGYSNVIKESQDFTYCIFDPQARLVAQGIPQPLHIGPISAQVREVHRVYNGRLSPGDAIIVGEFAILQDVRAIGRALMSRHGGVGPHP